MIGVRRTKAIGLQGQKRNPERTELVIRASLKSWQVNEKQRWFCGSSCLLGGKDRKGRPEERNLKVMTFLCSKRFLHSWHLFRGPSVDLRLEIITNFVS